MTMEEIDNRRMQPVGLLGPTEVTDLAFFINDTRSTKHDFAVIPLSHPSFKRVLFEDTDKLAPSEPQKQEMYAWQNGASLLRDELIVRTINYAEFILGQTSEWIDLESENHRVRLNSELALRKEAGWAAHLGLSAIMIPRMPVGNLFNFARAVNNMTEILSFTQVYIRFPLCHPSDPNPSARWEAWSTFQTLCDYNTKIFIALELPKELPAHHELLERWLAEPIKTIIIPADIFIPNSKGWPVLPKSHQNLIRKFMLLQNTPSTIVTDIHSGLHAKGGPSAYSEYIRHLNCTLPPPDEVQKFANGYQDYLQLPLQPLMDNLESSTYETFEKDPVKYTQYQKAVYHALVDRVPADSNIVTVIMVVGAGRGPLVNCSIRAAESAGRKVKLYAIEKNPNALVTLQNMKAETWGDLVTIVHSDMRRWNAPEKCDILVSELLGSFGDNELSPECLDGAQKFLKPDGISIPTSYTASVSPLSSTKLYNDVVAYKDLAHFETPYVVMLQACTQMSEPQDLWRFDHPNYIDIPPESDPVTNYHNIRRAHVTFVAKESMIIHGLAGYFESVLYGDISLSIHPRSHTPDMFSWFPIFFPIRHPIFVPKGAVFEVNFWRLTGGGKVWHEWSVLTRATDGTLLSVSPLHNPRGRSSWIGL